jgi:hypothetical protein
MLASCPVKVASTNEIRRSPGGIGGFSVSSSALDFCFRFLLFGKGGWRFLIICK